MLALLVDARIVWAAFGDHGNTDVIGAISPANGSHVWAHGQRAIVQQLSAYQAQTVVSMHGCESALATCSSQKEDADERSAELAADDDLTGLLPGDASECDGETAQEDVNMPCKVSKSQLAGITFTTSSVCYVNIKRTKLLLRLDYRDKADCYNLHGIDRLKATIDSFGRVLRYYMYKFWCNGAGPATGLITTAFQQEVKEQTLALCGPRGWKKFKVADLCMKDTTCVQAVRHLRGDNPNPGSCFFFSSFEIDFVRQSAREALAKDVWVIALPHCMALALCGLARRKRATHTGAPSAAYLLPIQRFVDGPGSATITVAQGVPRQQRARAAAAGGETNETDLELSLFVLDRRQGRPVLGSFDQMFTDWQNLLRSASGRLPEWFPPQRQEMLRAFFPEASASSHPHIPPAQAAASFAPL